MFHIDEEDDVQEDLVGGALGRIVIGNMFWANLSRYWGRHCDGHSQNKRRGQSGYSTQLARRAISMSDPLGLTCDNSIRSCDAQKCVCSGQKCDHCFGGMQSFACRDTS